MTRTDDQLVADFVAACRAVAHGEAADVSITVDEVVSIARGSRSNVSLQQEYAKLHNEPDVRAVIRKAVTDTRQIRRDHIRDAVTAEGFWDRVMIGGGLATAGAGGSAVLDATTTGNAVAALVGGVVLLLVGIAGRFGESTQSNDWASDRDHIETLIGDLDRVDNR